MSPVAIEQRSLAQCVQFTRIVTVRDTVYVASFVGVVTCHIAKRGHHHSDVARIGCNIPRIVATVC